MTKVHDTFTDLPSGTPFWFTAAAWLLPAGLLVQFLSAGAALFTPEEVWGLHAAIGAGLALPVLALLGGSLMLRRLRGFGWWAGLTALLYLFQIVLAVNPTSSWLSLHPFNGALLLTSSLVLLAKVERRRAQPIPG